MLNYIFICLWMALHLVHVSLMSIDQSPSGKELNIFARVYYDDFVKDYRTIPGKSGFNPSDLVTEPPADVVADYVANRIWIYAGKARLAAEITDYDLSENELSIKMICTMKKRSDSFRVINAIQAEIYPDQSNLVIFRSGDYEEGIKLTPEKREYLFKIKK